MRTPRGVPPHIDGTEATKELQVSEGANSFSISSRVVLYLERMYLYLVRKRYYYQLSSSTLTESFIRRMRTPRGVHDPIQTFPLKTMLK